MKHPTRADISEMKAGGCDAQTIADAEARLERGIAAQQICKVIEDAFDGVVLGGGVGLQEAQGSDDYKDEATCADFRAGDEKDDWRKIAAEALNVCNSSLSFFDAEGMRFHLPAYLICELCGDYRFDMAYCLTQTYQTIPEKFSLLDTKQRAAVRRYLLHLLHDPEYEYDRPQIERALNEFWTDEAIDAAG